MPQVVLLNGGPSSGKTSVARELQSVLDGVWLRLGVDTLLEAMPPSLSHDDGLEVKADGEVVVGARFAAVEDWWMAGIARMVEVGAYVVIEDNFMSGPAAQERWRAALDGVSVGWVSVRCDPVRAAEREHARGDRPLGMAAKQALAVLTASCTTLRWMPARRDRTSWLDASSGTSSGRPAGPKRDPLAAMDAATRQRGRRA
ncbi:MAG: chloramphenicol phosphotransferase CPT family protein [Actinomycetota bacterium]|nr:chloramphenicol phosphotransferase CPT family protein [Actinomycetota bacterium]